MPIIQKPIFVTFLLALAGALSQAYSAVWQPSPGNVQVPIWPGKVPDALPNPKPESVRADWPRIEDVSQPTMTVYAPKGHNTGVAMVVFPGGGYRFLAMDLEGTEICDWLTSLGVTCVLLKYRVPNSGPIHCYSLTSVWLFSSLRHRRWTGEQICPLIGSSNLSEQPHTPIINTTRRTVHEEISEALAITDRGDSQCE
jgi:hypothetical protein